jgi:hypothetical protein
MYVADGNFKADHVRQKQTTAELWLLDGGGIMPNVAEYKEFIASAVERKTVNIINIFWR